MLALGFGLIAACAWAVHDLLVRKLSQHTALLPMIMVVLAAGVAGLLVPVAVLGDWQTLTGPSLGFAAAAGLAYATAMGGLYRAFSLAPVRLIAPILGAYPMISLGFAAMGGKAVGWMEILAVLAIVGGIAVVAVTGRGEGAIARPGTAIGWAVVSSVGFASTFWLAQEAARQADGLAGILVTRLVALATVVALALALRAPLRALGGAGKTPVMMGLLDATALGLVTMSARLPSPEYAAISSSLFGVLTILLAWRVLKEQVKPWQWIGIATVFSGIAVLSSKG